MTDKFLYYLKPVIRILIFLFFIFIWSIPFGILSQYKFLNFPKGSFASDFVQEIMIVMAVLGALLMLFKIYPTRNFERIFIKKDAFIPFFKGSLVGLILITACTFLLYLNGNVQFSKTEIDFSLVLGYFLFFILVGIFEEFTFRTFPLVVFAERYLIPFSIVLNGILFGLIHFLNPNFSTIAMVNISLCGILFSITTLQKRNIWWAVGIHFGWNFTQGTLLGFKVSGLDQPGLISAAPMGNPILSGGLFGIEGSVICTLILICYITWLIFKTKMEPVIEINNPDELS